MTPRQHLWLSLYFFLGFAIITALLFALNSRATPPGIRAPVDDIPPWMEDAGEKRCVYRIGYTGRLPIEALSVWLLVDTTGLDVEGRLQLTDGMYCHDTSERSAPIERLLCAATTYGSAFGWKISPPGKRFLALLPIERDVYHRLQGYRHTGTYAGRLTVTLGWQNFQTTPTCREFWGDACNQKNPPYALSGAPCP